MPAISSFADARADNFSNGTVFGQLTHFALSATYTPAGGVERTVVIARRRFEPGATLGEFDAKAPERIWIECARDPSCPRGGIDSPQSGDQILLPDDPPGGTWLYDEQERHVTPYGWQLLFVRHWVRGRGPKQK